MADIVRLTALDLSCLASTVCDICFEDLGAGVVQMRCCNQMYHRECMQSWATSTFAREMNTKVLCPHCHQPLTTFCANRRHLLENKSLSLSPREHVETSQSGGLDAIIRERRRADQWPVESDESTACKLCEQVRELDYTWSDLSIATAFSWRERRIFAHQTRDCVMQVSTLDIDTIMSIVDYAIGR